MDIDNLTIGEARQIAAMFGQAQPSPKPSLLGRHIGLVCVVRSTPSGVWFGKVVAADDRGVVMVGARRAYYWKGAATCSGLATHGPDANGSKIPAAVPEVTVVDVCEVCTTTTTARERWAAVPEWVA